MACLFRGPQTIVIPHASTHVKGRHFHVPEGSAVRTSNAGFVFLIIVVSIFFSTIPYIIPV